MDLAGPGGLIRLLSSPLAHMCRLSPHDPTRRLRVAGGAWANSPMVVMRHSLRTLAVFSPTPGSFLTASGARKDASPPTGISSRPSGLHWSEATLAAILEPAMPTDTVTSSSLRTRALMSIATCDSGPYRLSNPVISRYASSMPIGSRKGV